MQQPRDNLLDPFLTKNMMKNGPEMSSAFDHGEVMKEGPTINIKEATRPSKQNVAENLAFDKLEVFPAYSYIDRNSRDIKGKTASFIALSLIDYLRLNSIQVKYEEDEPGKFKCRTFDFVSFRINMFAHNLDSNEPSILVEIQRRSGCALSFQKIRRSLLSTMDGLSMDMQQPCRRSSMSHETRCIDSCLNCFEGMPIQMKHDDSEKIAQEALEEIQGHLKSNSTDAQILALELLSHLTNPIHTPVQVVQVAAVKLLQSQEISESIKSLILEGQVRSKAIEDLDMDLQYEDDFVDNARQLSLCIFLNCFKAVSEHIHVILENTQGWMTEKILPCLLNNLRDIEENVHVALISTKVLSILNTHSKACRSFIVDNGIVDALGVVVVYGTVWHEEIRREAESLRSDILRM